VKRINKEEINVPVNCMMGDRFCGKCCYDTEMILLPQDIMELEQLGFPREYFVVIDNGLPRLRNIDGHCVFLDPSTNKCIVYRHRPLGCRLYPLVYDVDKNEVIVDKLCPKAHEITSDMVKRYSWVFQYIIEYVRSYTSRDT